MRLESVAGADERVRRRRIECAAHAVARVLREHVCAAGRQLTKWSKVGMLGPCIEDGGECDE